MPKIGKVVADNGSGLLDAAAHRRALRGDTVSYRYTLLQRTYRIDLKPRRGPKRTVVGVQGALTLLSARPNQRTLTRSALQSLEV